MNTYLEMKNALNPTTDGTYDLRTGKAVEFLSGYQFSIERPNTELNLDIVPTLETLFDGVYLGVWEGTKEFSFHTDNYGMAVLMGRMYEQDAIWDWVKMEPINLKG